MLRVAALDIGGANIKACGPAGECFTQPFELWREPGLLAEALAACIRRFEPLDVLAVTMTGELCDCYATKREGVLSILEGVENARRAAARTARVLVWGIDGRFVTLREARGDPLPAAAANWLALAIFAARFAPRGAGLLIDTGSTTTDIVPLCDGQPVPTGRTDTARLVAGELVYSGASRTPIAAVVEELPYRGERCPAAAELFATTRDAYIVLGRLPEDPQDTRTADNRPATKACSADRLARMLCADRESFSAEDARTAAAHIFAEQERTIRDAARKVASRLCTPLETVVVSGSGEFLARAAAEEIGGHRIVSLSRELGEAASAAAPAYALRELARGMPEPLE